MNSIDVFYLSDDGLRLYARDQPGPGADAPAVLCLPGLTRNGKDFGAIAERLRRRHRVICPDQRGRGRSQRDPDAAHYVPMRYVQDMFTLLDTLGFSRVTVIGTSLGGLMGMLMLALQPQRVEALVLNDVGPVIDPAGIARLATYVGKSAPVANWDEAIAQTAAINGIAFPGYGRADWAAMARNVYVQEGTQPVLDYDPAIAQGVAAGTAAPDLWPLFDGLAPRPMLVIRGELSDILSPQTLAEMQRRRPTLQTVTVPGVGHAPMLDEVEAVAAIEPFLAGMRV